MGDLLKEQSALVHVEAAKANPARAELELTQAQNLAKLIEHSVVRHRVLLAIHDARVDRGLPTQPWR